MRRRERSAQCAATRCCAVVERGNLMCRAHWLSLPLPLRRSILFTHQHRWVRDYQGYVREAVEMIEAREGRFTGIFESPAARQVATCGHLGGGHAPSPAFVGEAR